MAYLKSDISGQVLHYHEMPDIVISSVIGTPVRLVISTDGKGVLLDETYWPDFNGEISVDIKDIVANELFLEIPSTDEDRQQSSIFKTFRYDIAEGELSGMFTVNGFSKEALARISDIDLLRIPEDYLLPLSIVNACQRSGIIFSMSDGNKVECEGLETEASGVGITSRMIRIQDFPEVTGTKRFTLDLECGESRLYAPVFEICNGHFEQYLFANRYGGFDNIAMDGTLEFAPEMSFESGSYNGTSEQTVSDAEYVYGQNSGYLSGKTLEVMSELLCSAQIYHMDKNGDFRRIVILESTLSSKSNAFLHSFSFKFKYADDSRPLSLKGKTSGNDGTRAGSSVNTLVFELTDSPMEIRHNKTGFPCVTVVDKDNQVVTTEVAYIDENNVSVSWNGDLSGYVYIR